MPEEFAVHKSKRMALLLGAFGALLCCLLLYQTISFYVSDKAPKEILSGLVAAFIVGLSSIVPYVTAIQQPLVLVIFRRGLFWPTLQREVIPWSAVESVRITHIGRGRSVVVVFSKEFTATLDSVSRIPPMLAKIEALIGWKGKILSARMLDHSVEEIVHVIDDWIRYERGLPIKPPRRHGPIDMVFDWIRGRDATPQ